MIIGHIFQKHSHFDQFDFEPRGNPVVAMIKLFALADSGYFLNSLQACQINHLHFLFPLDLLVHDREGKVEKSRFTIKIPFFTFTVLPESFIAQEHLPEQTTHQSILL